MNLMSLLYHAAVAFSTGICGFSFFCAGTFTSEILDAVSILSTSKTSAYFSIISARNVANALHSSSIDILSVILLSIACLTIEVKHFFWDLGEAGLPCCLPTGNRFGLCVGPMQGARSPGGRSWRFRQFGRSFCSQGPVRKDISEGFRGKLLICSLLGS